jgi:hypothetical protein
MFRKTGIPLLTSGLLLGATLPGNSLVRPSLPEPAVLARGATAAIPSVRILQFQCLARAAAEARVPALERGGLKTVDVLPGEHAAHGSQLAALDDREAVLTVELAERELRVARQKFESSRKVQIAETAVEEGRQQLEEAEEQAKAAELLAADESPVRLARKLEELAEDKHCVQVFFIPRTVFKDILAWNVSNRSSCWCFLILRTLCSAYFS